MIRAVLSPRGWDKYGAGFFGASRGDRAHNGVDYACTPGLEILSPVCGEVTKLGYCYNDDAQYRYVEVRDADDFYHRVFYIEPEVEPGDLLTISDIIGTAQDISNRYPDGMTPHVHYEIKNADGDHIDPEKYANN